MSKTSPLHPTGPKPQTSTNFRKNIVPSRPFAPLREAQHDTAQQRQVPSSATGPASAYGIQSRCPGQLVIHTNDYRRAVGICVVNRHGLVFAAKRRVDMHANWQMPQGGIDPAEDPMDAALRELREETGIQNVKIVAAVDQWLHYDFPTQVRAPHPTRPWLRYHGQAQKWFLVQYLGEDDSEIDLDGVGHEPEFSEFAWMQLEQLPEQVVSFKQQVYREVQRHFAPRIRQLVAEAHHWQQGIC